MRNSQACVHGSRKRTLCWVHCARYAALKHGLTAVPVIQGIAAVVTTVTSLDAACKLLEPLCSLGGMSAYIAA